MKTDRIVVITGAAGGMGAVFVRRFLNNGDTVIATDSSQDSLAKLAESMNSARLHIRAADITDEADTKALADLARQTTGRVDVLVNVAGDFPLQPFLEMTAADWRKIIDINLTGTALMCQAMLPLITGRGWGRVINIGSASIYSGVPDQAHYVAAKAGMIGLSRSLAREFGSEGVCVYVVEPGLTITAAAKKALPQSIQDTAIAVRCLNREEHAGDLTGAVFFLASPDADFITGQTIIVDGGNEML
ncbi:MAG: SDR family oxidoreductase [Acetobacteraceae bacterium]|nr:SDR family oxidoreductase [Acetobacteraceae bacterium]